MADAYWMQLGRYPTFALEVARQIVGITYWLDAGELSDEVGDSAPLPDSGWYFVAVTRPREPERVAEGLELRPDMSSEELAETTQDALEVVANEVLAEEGEE
jgi:hypothetical protein